jgi:citrate lyase beta subunit
MAVRMRSKLFIPGSRPALFDKALAGPADAISIDLEDAVLEERKDEARALVGAFLGAAGESKARTALGSGAPAAAPTRKLVVVRVNDATTRHHAADLEAIVSSRLDIVNLPKVEDPDVVVATATSLARMERERGIGRPIGLLLNIESPKGLRRAADVAAAHPRVVGLQVGLGDLFEPLGIDRRDEAAVAQILLAIRLGAAEGGVPAFDGAWADVADEDGFRREAARARRLGFAGKSCIHPRQVAVANAAFAATDAEFAFARRVLDAWVDAEARGLGAIVVDGRMIDKPFVARARAIVAEREPGAAA